MGADLLGYMVFGPRTLPSKDVCFKWFEEHKDATGNICVQEEDEEAGEEEVTMDATEFTVFIESFYEFWPSNSRDSVCRDLPNTDRLVIFAGEPSWGDEPDGHGYTLLKAMTRLSLSTLLGID